MASTSSPAVQSRVLELVTADEHSPPSIIRWCHRSPLMKDLTQASMSHLASLKRTRTYAGTSCDAEYHESTSHTDPSDQPLDGLTSESHMTSPESTPFKLTNRRPASCGALDVSALSPSLHTLDKSWVQRGDPHDAEDDLECAATEANMVNVDFYMLPSPSLFGHLRTRAVVSRETGNDADTEGVAAEDHAEDSPRNEVRLESPDHDDESAAALGKRLAAAQRRRAQMLATKIEERRRVALRRRAAVALARMADHMKRYDMARRILHSTEAAALRREKHLQERKQLCMAHAHRMKGLSLNEENIPQVEAATEFDCHQMRDAFASQRDTLFQHAVAALRHFGTLESKGLLEPPQIFPDPNDGCSAEENPHESLFDPDRMTEPKRVPLFDLRGQRVTVSDDTLHIHHLHLAPCRVEQCLRYDTFAPCAQCRMKRPSSQVCTKAATDKPKKHTKILIAASTGLLKHLNELSEALSKLVPVSSEAGHPPVMAELADHVLPLCFLRAAYYRDSVFETAEQPVSHSPAENPLRAAATEANTQVNRTSHDLVNQLHFVNEGLILWKHVVSCADEGECDTDRALHIANDLLARRLQRLFQNWREYNEHHRHCMDTEKAMAEVDRCHALSVYRELVQSKTRIQKELQNHHKDSTSTLGHQRLKEQKTEDLLHGVEAALIQHRRRCVMFGITIAELDIVERTAAIDAD